MDPTASALNQIPLVNSTQILTASSQPQMTSIVGSTPIVASTPLVASTPIVTSAVQPSVVATSIAQPVMTSTVPIQQAAMPTTTGVNFATTNFYSVPGDSDYRLGRGIFDDFRQGGYKSGYKSQIATSSVVGISQPGLAVTTPAVNVGQSNIKDFL